MAVLIPNDRQPPEGFVGPFLVNPLNIGDDNWYVPLDDVRAFWNGTSIHDLSDKQSLLIAAQEFRVHSSVPLEQRAILRHLSHLRQAEAREPPAGIAPVGGRSPSMSTILRPKGQLRLLKMLQAYAYFRSHREERTLEAGKAAVILQRSGMGWWVPSVSDYEDWFNPAVTDPLSQLTAEEREIAVQNQQLAFLPKADMSSDDEDNAGTVPYVARARAPAVERNDADYTARYSGFNFLPDDAGDDYNDAPTRNTAAKRSRDSDEPPTPRIPQVQFADMPRLPASSPNDYF